MRYVALGDTFYFKFTTRDFDTGAPQTLGGVPVISAYEDANATQITSGIVLTADYDSVTGLNHVSVVATAGNGYEAGKYYAFVITTGTVDTVSVVGESVHEIVVGPVDANAAEIGGQTVTAAAAITVNAEVGASATAMDAFEDAFDGTGFGFTSCTMPTTTTVTNDVGVNEWNGVALGTTNPLPNAAAGAAGGLPTDSAGKTSFNDVSTAEVNTQCDTALSDIGLDHLVSAAVIGTDVTDNSIIARLASSSATADWDSYANTTDSLQAVRDHIGDGTNLTEAGSDGDHLTAINLPNQTMDITGNLSGSVGSVTGNVGGNVTGSVGSLATQAKTDVNTEIVDVLKTDTISEQAQGIPPSTPTFEEAVMYLYMALRNKIDVTSSLKEFHNDAGTVVWKKTVSDDTTTYSEAKGASGP